MRAKKYIGRDCRLHWWRQHKTLGQQEQPPAKPEAHRSLACGQFTPNRCALHGENLFNASRMWDGTRAMLEAEDWKPMPTEAKPCLDYEKDDWRDGMPLLAIREGGKS